VNKLYFGQNNKKVGKFSFKKNIFYLICYLSNLGKYKSQISQGKSKKTVPFPRIEAEVLIMQKNLSLLFFRSEEVILSTCASKIDFF